MPALGLLAGDRLTEGAGLGDVDGFEKLATFPCTVVFWRSSNDTITRHNNPIFNEGMGRAPNRVFAIDSLRCLYLGVMLVFCRRAVWHYLEAGAFGRHRTIDEQVEAGCLTIRGSLKPFYKRYDRDHPSTPLTCINRFSSKHIGFSDDWCLRTKAAQTWGISAVAV